MSAAFMPRAALPNAPHWLMPMPWPQPRPCSVTAPGSGVMSNRTLGTALGSPPGGVGTASLMRSRKSTTGTTTVSTAAVTGAVPGCGSGDCAGDDSGEVVVVVVV